MLSYTESIATRNSTVPTLRQSLESAYSRPELSIKLKGDKKTSFTTNDTIEGEVIFTTHSDTRFDDVSITFEGTSRTWMDKFGASPSTGSGRTSTTQTFLSLVQPIDESSYPIPRVASGTVSFPFTFVVPSHLLPTACSSKDQNLTVKAAHLQLPPSLGDVPKDYCTDDMAPDMAHISYHIRAKVHRRRERDNSRVCIISAAHRLHIRPVFEEAPPVHVSAQSSDYVLRKEKDLRKGFLGRKIGRLTVAASEPSPMHLNTSAICPATTTVPIELTFTPSEQLTIPPPLGCVTTKLRASTFFSTTHTSYLPTPSRTTIDPAVAHYYESSLLSARNISNTRWESTTDPATGKLLYKVHLNIPITEPKGKTLVPSFSTCFISRSYRLDMSVSVHTSGHSEPSLSLKLPLQVDMPTKAGQDEQAALGYQSVDEFFTPRSVAPPAWTASSSEATPSPDSSHHRSPAPGYSMFGGHVSRIPSRIPEPVGISPGCG